MSRDGDTKQEELERQLKEEIKKREAEFSKKYEELCQEYGFMVAAEISIVAGEIKTRYFAARTR